MNKGENAKTDRVLRDDELDAVSGGRVNHHDFNIVLAVGFSLVASNPATI